ncbi:MAG: hypothetical protein HGB37_01525 [Candidatus Moranbacteria bacterium]|nr:hypothetical protein [Candidatus Moranbacteria bacterium]
MSTEKSKLIKGFRKGLGYKTFEPDGFRSATLNVTDSGDLVLPRSVAVSSEIAATTSGDTRFASNSRGAFMVLTNPATLLVEIWRTLDGLTWTKKKTCSYTFASAQSIFAKKGTDLVVVFDSDLPHLTYSFDGGDSWTETAPAIGNVTDICFFDEYIYLGEGELNILRTKDFVTYELVHEFGVGSDTYFFTVGSTLFVRHDDKIYRKTESDEFVRDQALDSIPFHFYFGTSFGDDVALFYALTATGYLDVYLYDGELKLLRRLPWSAPTVRALYICDGFGFFVSDDTTRKLYAIDIDSGSVFFVESYPTVTSGASHDYDPMPFLGERLYVCEAYSGGPITASKLRVSKTSNYSLSAAVLETGEIDCATHSPRRIVLRHNPLLAGHTVKVYVRFNRATAYGLILTSETDGAVVAMYDWPPGSGPYEFVEFKIELQTTDTATTPGGVDLEYIYLPMTLMK